MEVVSQCALCLKTARLQDSHFIPKAAYKLVRGNGQNPHPLVLQTDTAMQTAAQTRAHLLCYDCEQRFHKNGENTFFKYCYRGDGTFKLLERIQTGIPVLDQHNYSVYNVPLSNNADIEAVGYFAASIFWKSAVCVWKDAGMSIPSISLGRQYQEEFRKYLLGEFPFPTNAALIVEVSDKRNRLISAFGTPQSTKLQTYYNHWIDIFGIHFNLLVGAHLPSQLRGMSILNSGQKRVLLTKDKEGEMVENYRDLLDVAVKKRKSEVPNAPLVVKLFTDGS